MPEWQRWPAAKLESRMIELQRQLGGDRWIPLPAEPGLVIHRQKPAVTYDLAPHTACWRTYGELSIVDSVVLPGRLRDFVRAYGPLWSTDTDTESYTRSNGGLAQHFHALSQLWAPATDSAAVSEWQAAPDEHIAEFGNIEWHWLNLWLAGEGNFTPPKGSLLRFMVIQAVRHASEHTPMRRCAGCGHWIELTRTSRRHCAPACRTLQWRKSGGY
jgi:hypothetical protein